MFKNIPILTKKSYDHIIKIIRDVNHTAFNEMKAFYILKFV